MTYNEDFYDAYDDYLEEPSVREAHDWIFKIAMMDYRFHRVVDFGCGRSQEFRRNCPSRYLGIDINFGEKVDYRSIDLKELNSKFHPNSFVSLFSSEITDTLHNNYTFYHKVFNETDATVGLVSGFFYSSKKGSTTVVENGNILSFQTVEEIDTVSCDLFSEKRIILPVPSKMFGEDVFEVWKLMEKKWITP